MLDRRLDDLLDTLPEFVRRVGSGLLGLLERVAPRVADVLEPYAAIVGWGMFAVAAVVIAMCVTGLFTRR
jgi:hypothetical protein